LTTVRKTRAWLTPAIAVAMMAPASEARADVGVGVDWEQFVVEVDAFVRRAPERPPPRHAEHASQLVEQNAGNAWFGVAPNVTVVARDWGSAFKIAGDRLSLVDALRLSSSTRMVLSRIRLSDLRSTRLVPFLQVGAGQWRTDPNLLPLMPRHTELAGQGGAGVELTLARTWHIACEATMTALYLERGEGGDLPSSTMWSASIASRLAF
jgi:hypothetical protein